MPDQMPDQMPYMALVRNLNNAMKSGVVEQEAARDYIGATLGDPERVAKSTPLPFRFGSALKAIEKETGEEVERLRAVLSAALEISFATMPERGARVLVANAISGSMSANPSSRSDRTMAESAGIFAAAAFNKAQEGDRGRQRATEGDRGRQRARSSASTPRRIRALSQSRRGSPRARRPSQAISGHLRPSQAISGHLRARWRNEPLRGGGTSLSAPLEYAFAGKRVFDVAIFLTDSER
jgi:hypothetical protein